ncbi:hypothetical protein Dimus_008447 [Dionaea muscipula]
MGRKPKEKKPKEKASPPRVLSVNPPDLVDEALSPIDEDGGQGSKGDAHHFDSEYLIDDLDEELLPGMPSTSSMDGLKTLNPNLGLLGGRKSAIIEMKPSQRFIHFLGNEKCDTSIWEERHLKLLDLTYMDHLMARRLVNLPRVMMRHMSYVISMKDHELLYGDWLTLVFEAFGVPLVIKKGEEPKKYDFFEDTFLTMCKLTREDGIWWIGSGENRRRDDDEAAPEEEAEGDDEGNKDDFDWEAVIDEATVEGESESDDQFYDAQVGEEEPRM